MSQSRRRSAIESAAVTAIGLGYAVPVNYLFIRHSSLIPDPWLRAIILTGLLTLLSFMLKFFSRRFFNWLDEVRPDE